MPRVKGECDCLPLQSEVLSRYSCRLECLNTISSYRFIEVEKITWQPEYSVGVERLDQQHKKIIAAINALIAKPRLFVKSATIADVLLELNNYVSEHFLLEEQLLTENNYPDLVGHSKKHTKYSERIAGFCSRSAGKDKNVREELLHYLGEWWIGHILHEDMNYKSFFDDKGIR